MASTPANIIRITLVNATVLIGLGLWGLLAQAETSNTTLIPLAFGLVFGASMPLYREGNRLITYLLLILTLLLTIALWIPMTRAYRAGHSAELIRLILMVFSCLSALFFYVVAFLRQRSRSKS